MKVPPELRSLRGSNSEFSCEAGRPIGRTFGDVGLDGEAGAFGTVGGKMLGGTVFEGTVFEGIASDGIVFNGAAFGSLLPEGAVLGSRSPCGGAIVGT